MAPVLHPEHGYNAPLLMRPYTKILNNISFSSVIPIKQILAHPYWYRGRFGTKTLQDAGKPQCYIGEAAQGQNNTDWYQYLVWASLMGYKPAWCTTRTPCFLSVCHCNTKQPPPPMNSRCARGCSLVFCTRVTPHITLQLVASCWELVNLPCTSKYGLYWFGSTCSGSRMQP